MSFVSMAVGDMSGARMRGSFRIVGSTRRARDGGRRCCGEVTSGRPGGTRASRFGEARGVQDGGVSESS